jgi:antitoxin ParD1/3/4
MEDEEGKSEAFRAAVLEGMRSGPSTPFDFDAFMARKRREHEERAQKPS